MTKRLYSPNPEYIWITTSMKKKSRIVDFVQHGGKQAKTEGKLFNIISVRDSVCMFTGEPTFEIILRYVGELK